MTDLEALLGRIRERDPYLACEVGPTPDRDPALLITPARLASAPDALESLADAYGARWGVAGDRCSQASFIVLDLSWYAFAPLVTAYLAEGVGPSLAGASVWLDPETRMGSLILARDASASPMSVEDLRAAITGFMAPVVDAIGDRRWIGRRTAWWGVGDRVGGAFEYVGALLGDDARARAAVSELLGPSDSPLASPRHRFSSYVHRGEERTIGLRASCCRFYRVPDNDYCTTCPILREPDRRARVEAEIDAELDARVPA